MSIEVKPREKTMNATETRKPNNVRLVLAGLGLVVLGGALALASFIYCRLAKDSASTQRASMMERADSKRDTAIANSNATARAIQGERYQDACKAAGRLVEIGPETLSDAEAKVREAAEAKHAETEETVERIFTNTVAHAVWLQLAIISLSVLVGIAGVGCILVALVRR
jgi:hypothetical protein